MNKLDMKTKDSINENIVKIRKLFPNVVVETNHGYGINFDALKQELSDVVIDDKKEKYELTWPGKKESILEGNVNETKTLRPIREKSVDFDNTKNIYIEGDNLEALKILQESYLNKIKCVYIDPPYNTGNDFIYNDNFNKGSDNELEESGQIDECGNKLVSNPSSNGRFHSDWLSMMYPRIKLARNLLTDDGIIFISIDDNELYNLKKICDEVFGESSYVTTIVVESGGAFGAKTAHKNKTIFKVKDYVLVYVKNSNCDAIRMPLYDKASDPFDPRYNYYMNDGELIPLIDYFRNNKSIRNEFEKYNLSVDKNNISKLMIIDNDFNNMMIGDLSKNIYKDSQFTLALPNDINEKFKNTRICDYNGYKLFKTQTGNIRHLQSFYESLKLNDELDSRFERSMLRGDLWKNFVKDMGNVGKEGNVDFKNGKKPVRLIEQLIKWVNISEGYVLDFFSGSGTTAHAVMNFNAKNNKNINFILMQLSERCDGEFETICDIGEERIRRASKKIKEETNADIDYGFRVYKVDSSNMKDEFYKPAKELDQTQLFSYVDNIKDDRSPEDLLTQVILDLGLTLDLKVEEKHVGNNKIYVVDENSLVACFDENVSDNVVNEIANIKPLKVVFRDSSFTGDKDKINFEERLKRLSPDTEFNVL